MNSESTPHADAPGHTEARRSDAQHDAVCRTEDSHCVVVAPPGTGKTHLAVRLAGELTARLPPSSGSSASSGPKALLLTFSNQARVQLEREVRKQLDPVVRRRVVVSNYHSLFYSAVLAHRRALGLPMDPKIVSAAERKQAFAATDPATTGVLSKTKGLLDAFAELAVPQFRDERAPNDDQIARLINVVGAEQRAGRLVFDDLGALFWRLLDQFPVIEDGYRARYPIVIADEHQDASALQDAVVRRIASQTLVVLADPMQLIHGYRGASAERLEAHLRETTARFQLSTPHRWHGRPDIGTWLLDVRATLQREQSTTHSERPLAARVLATDGTRGLNAVLAQIKYTVVGAFKTSQRIAVLTRTNDDAARIRRYLSNNNCHPRSADPNEFETSRADITYLEHHSSPQEVANLAINRLETIVPGLTSTTMKQLRSRVESNGLKLKGTGALARAILKPLEPIYQRGVAYYFQALSEALQACQDRGYHIPQIQTVRIIRDTAADINQEGQAAELQFALTAYSRRCTDLAVRRTVREGRGLYVMNVHQSKGKEFDHVIVAPASGRHFSETDEDRRLFYVALTRARSAWTFITPDSDRSPLLESLG